MLLPDQLLKCPWPPLARQYLIAHISCRISDEGRGTRGEENLFWILVTRYSSLVPELGGGSYQLHPGARINRYRCSLPGLAEFTAYRREGTDTSHHKVA